MTDLTSKAEELVALLRRADGSELLPKVLLGHLPADMACLKAADLIEAQAAEIARLRRGAEDIFEPLRDNDASTAFARAVDLIDWQDAP